MDDRRAQFLIIVEDTCLGSSLAELEVELTLIDGDQLRGIPSIVEQTTNADEDDDLGVMHRLLIDGTEIGLAEVVGCAVRLRPAVPPS